MEVTRHYGTHHCPVLSCLRVTSMPGRTRSQRRLHRTRRDCGPRAQRRGRRRCGGNGGAGDASDGRTFLLVVVSKGRTTSDDLPCRNSGASSANNFSPGPITPVRKSAQGTSLCIVSFPPCRVWTSLKRHRAYGRPIGRHDICVKRMASVCRYRPTTMGYNNKSVSIRGQITSLWPVDNRQRVRGAAGSNPATDISF